VAQANSAHLLPRVPGARSLNPDFRFPIVSFNLLTACPVSERPYSRPFRLVELFFHFFAWGTAREYPLVHDSALHLLLLRIFLPRAPGS
jgi:hypothetical protein